MRGEIAIYKGPGKTDTVTVANGGTTSGALDCRGLVATHIALPAGFDDVSLEIEGSMDGSTFYDLYDSNGSQLTMTVAHTRMYQLPTACWGVPYLRFVVGAQTGAITLTVSLA